MLGGYDLLHSSVLYYTRHSIRIRRNGLKSGGGVSSSRGIFKRKSLQSLSTKGKHHTHKNSMVPKDKNGKKGDQLKLCRRTGSCSVAQRVLKSLQ